MISFAFSLFLLNHYSASEIHKSIIIVLHYVFHCWDHMLVCLPYFSFSYFFSVIESIICLHLHPKPSLQLWPYSTTQVLCCLLPGRHFLVAAIFTLQESLGKIKLKLRPKKSIVPHVSIACATDHPGLKPAIIFEPVSNYRPSWPEYY